MLNRKPNAAGAQYIIYISRCCTSYSIFSTKPTCDAQYYLNTMLILETVFTQYYRKIDYDLC